MTPAPPSRWRLRYYWDLLAVLVARDIKLRYKRSAMGMAWTLLNPLAELVVLLFVFQVVLPIRTPNYTAFLFTGILVFGWFQSSLLFAAGVIVSSRELIRQPGFPPAILPVVTVTSSLIHLIMALPVLAIFLVLGGGHFTATLAALPALIAVQFLFTLSLGYLVAALHVSFRDTQYLLKIALQFLFYLSPVFYPTSQVPIRFRGGYDLNPLAFLIEGYRAILLRGEIPNLAALALLAIVAAALLLVGFAVFRRASHRFVEELG